MHTRSNRITWIWPAITFVLVIGLWQFADYVFQIPNILLPSPSEIFAQIVKDFWYLLEHTGVTVYESILGFILGSIGGILTAVMFTYSKTLKKSLYPYSIALKAVPVIALAPLFIMWFGSGMTSKVIMSGVITYFPTLVGTVKGLASSSKQHLAMFKLLKASSWQTFWKLRLPSALPYMFPALKVSATFAVVGATIAEFTGASKGVGYVIVSSSYYLETSTMFAAIIFICLSGLLFFYIVDYAERKIVFWEKS